MKSRLSHATFLAVLVFVVIFGAVTQSVHARTITIQADGSGEYPTIQAAIDDANDGDIIVVQPGTYTGDGNRDIDFLGKAITVRSTNPNDPSVVAATAIDCNGSETDPHRGFYFHNNEDANSVLDGITITNGYASGSYPDFAGGAIYCYSSSPKISRCLITGNTAQKAGGGIVCDWNSNPVISWCIISDNIADDRGGGISCWNSSPTITHCTIMDNYVYRRGGGISCEDWGSPVISHCMIGGNQADFQFGGGVYISHGSPMIVGCRIVGNSSGQHGGGISLDASDATIRECTITGNLAQHEDTFGGGLYFSLGNLTITNSILWGNTAPNGAEIGVYSWSGVYDGPPVEPYPKWTLSTAYSNVRDGRQGVYFLGDPNWTLFNWEPGNIDTDPCFVDPCNSDYHLLAGSPCIDAGDPNYVAGPNETDLDGYPRIVNGVVDMGAYEVGLANPGELLSSLIEEVTGLDLPKGIANSLLAKLGAALKALGDENQKNDVSAVNTIGAFINAVEAQRGKKISVGNADTLIGAASEIIELLFE